MENGSNGKPEHRRAKRRQVLKRGQLVFGLAGSTVDCLILDETSFGVQLETPLMTQFPEHLRLRFADGAMVDARLQWSTGSKAGLEILGPQIQDDVTQGQREAISRALKTQGVKAAVHLLKGLDFFASDALREAAEAAEAAYARLQALLE